MRSSGPILGLALLGLAAGCRDMPTSPTPSQFTARTPVAAPPAPSGATVAISGRLWLHDAAGTRPSAGALWGFVQTARGGHTTGPLAVGTDGSYRLSIPVDGFVHLYAGEFQPCVVRVASAEGVSSLTADVHVVADRARLGANLPPELQQRAPTLSGTVYEVMEDGRRVPLADTRVELDGLGGMGLVIATTLTDANGRYVICGLDGDREPYLYATHQGHRMFESTVHVDGNTVFDIQMQR